MADIKWIKLTINIFEDEKIRLIDAMPERDTIHYVWIRLLVQAGKTNSNGFIFLSENIQYTDEMLATIFCRPLASIRLALKTLKDFGMIEIDEDNLIKIANWEKHQNIEGMDRVRAQNRKRVENHREKKKQLEAAAEKNEEISAEIEDNDFNVAQNLYNVTENKSNVTDDKSNVTVTMQNKRETKNKKEIKNKKERENTNAFDEERGSSFEKSEPVKTSVSQFKDSITEQTKDSRLRQAKAQTKEQINDVNAEQIRPPTTEHIKNLTTEQEKNLIDINAKCFELQKYCETITGIVGSLNSGALKVAISMHGQQYVKMAIDIALKVNKPNMTYIDGILKNWRREGYPNDKEVKKNGNRSYGKNSNPDKNEFTGFKPKKPRSLTAAERRKAEENLI